MNKFSVQNLIGKGYNNGWFTNNHCRYRCFKGARNTKKSYIILGYEALFKLLECKLRNIMFIRQVKNDNRKSTFSTICMLINQFQLTDYFHINNNSMCITYKPTGQVMLFEGMQHPESITSVRTVHGYLTDIYVEEAFQIKDYEEWRKVDGSLRGKLPDGLFMQITFVLNAWNKDHWIYEHFFKGRLEDDLEYLLTHDYQEWCDPDLVIDYGKGLYLHTSTYKVNEFRDVEVYDTAMEELRKVAPEIYKVEALGMWGNSTGATYPEFSEQLIIPPVEVSKMRFVSIFAGIDTGLSDGEGRILKDKEGQVRVRSATTMQLVGLTNKGELIAIDEFYHTNENTNGINSFTKKTEPELQLEIINILMNWVEEKYYNLLQGSDLVVYVDSADMGYRAGLEKLSNEYGGYYLHFMPSTKIKIQSRVDFERLNFALGGFKISQLCSNLIREFKNSKKGADGKVREDLDDHCINAYEYAWSPMRFQIINWDRFKER